MISNFNYYNPVKIVFGKDTIKSLSDLVEKKQKVMLTYGGGSIFKNGVYDQVKAALKDIDTIEFGGIEPNPTFETLMKGVELARQEKVSFLLAVGGGSVLDGTKFMAAAIPFEGGDEWDNIVLGKGNYQTALPLGSVMTLPATGSEMNYYSVISRQSSQEKKGMGNPLLYPKFSILDPSTTFSLPIHQVANGIGDAFTHVMEQYMTYPVGAEIQDRFAESILSTLIEVGSKTLKEPNDYEARSNLVWAATVALNGWISTGVPTDWATHQIGHELTALHGIDHAQSLAVVLPHLLTYKFEDKKAKLAQYGRRVWQLEGDNESIAKQSITKTIDFFESIQLPVKASKYGVNLDSIATIKQRFEASNAQFGENRDIDGNAAAEILTMSIS